VLTSLKLDSEHCPMSSTTLITAIIILLAALVCYAFVSQTIAQKKQQQQRIVHALDTRARNFKFMLSGLPAGFLPKELILLIYRSLMHVLEQLIKLEPTQKTTQVVLDNPQKAQEIKICLEELYKFIFQLEGKKGMTKPQADAYRNMIKELVLQLTVDNYMLHGRLAREKDKLRLAIHYFDLALRLMIRERTSGQFDEKIGQMQTLLSELNAQNRNQSGSNSEIPQEEVGADGVSEEWDKFQQESTWKKKQIYD
jgi:hypothetical protein